MKIKVSGVAGVCATAWGDSAANDKMTVCEEISKWKPNWEVR